MCLESRFDRFFKLISIWARSDINLNYSERAIIIIFIVISFKEILSLINIIHNNNLIIKRGFSRRELFLKSHLSNWMSECVIFFCKCYAPYTTVALNKDRGHIRISPNLEQLLCNFSKNTWSICTRCITPDVVVPHKDNMAKKCFSATSFIASALWSLEDAILSFSIFTYQCFSATSFIASFPLRRKFLSHFTFYNIAIMMKKNDNLTLHAYTWHRQTHWHEFIITH